ncbi:uncharacterized protein CLUP02_03602 [Colletotrichum lupini]|uniref:Uncharacterized protein n=1 Tax=Colletotrichum lupini TaxID=145971 RepID=A0A9Q8WBY7_9PEZI|nr:uncharacterized protein CLUP02_03602 [Colletotrichum lupini]UQC78128.1 hypothetical protein CLUP02_03602 [Colletotrichum lupini]
MRRNGRQDRPFSVTLRCGSWLLPAARILHFSKFVAVVWTVEPSYIRYRRYLFQSSSLLDAASSFKLSQRLFTHPPVFRVLLHKKQKEQPTVPMSSSLLKRSPAVERTVGLFDVGRGNCRRRDRFTSGVAQDISINSDLAKRFLLQIQDLRIPPVLHPSFCGGSWVLSLAPTTKKAEKRKSRHGTTRHEIPLQQSVPSPSIYDDGLPRTQLPPDFDGVQPGSRARLCPDGDTGLHQSWIRVTHSKPPGPIKPSWLSLLAEATKNQEYRRISSEHIMTFKVVVLKNAYSQYRKEGITEEGAAEEGVGDQGGTRLPFSRNFRNNSGSGPEVAAAAGSDRVVRVGRHQFTPCCQVVKPVLPNGTLRRNCEKRILWPSSSEQSFSCPPYDVGIPIQQKAWTLEQLLDYCFVSSSVLRRLSPANFQRASGAPGLSIGLEPPNREAIVLCLRDDQAATVAPLLSHMIPGSEILSLRVASANPTDPRHANITRQISINRECRSTRQPNSDAHRFNRSIFGTADWTTVEEFRFGKRGANTTNLFTSLQTNNHGCVPDRAAFRNVLLECIAFCFCGTWANSTKIASAMLAGIGTSIVQTFDVPLPGTHTDLLYPAQIRLLDVLCHWPPAKRFNRPQLSNCLTVLRFITEHDDMEELNRGKVSGHAGPWKMIHLAISFQSGGFHEPGDDLSYSRCRIGGWQQVSTRHTKHISASPRLFLCNRACGGALRDPNLLRNRWIGSDDVETYILIWQYHAKPRRKWSNHMLACSAEMSGAAFISIHQHKQEGFAPSEVPWHARLPTSIHDEVVAMSVRSPFLRGHGHSRQSASTSYRWSSKKRVWFPPIRRLSTTSNMHTYRSREAHESLLLLPIYGPLVDDATRNAMRWEGGILDVAEAYLVSLRRRSSVDAWYANVVQIGMANLVFDLLPMKITGLSISRPYSTSRYVSVDEHAEEVKWWDGMAVSHTASLRRWAEAIHVQRTHQGNAMLRCTSARCIPFEWTRLKLKTQDLKLRSIPLRSPLLSRPSSGVHCGSKQGLQGWMRIGMLHHCIIIPVVSIHQHERDLFSSQKREINALVPCHGLVSSGNELASCKTKYLRYLPSLWQAWSYIHPLILGRCLNQAQSISQHLHFPFIHLLDISSSFLASQTSSSSSTFMLIVPDSRPSIPPCDTRDAEQGNGTSATRSDSEKSPDVSSPPNHLAVETEQRLKPRPIPILASDIPTNASPILSSWRFTSRPFSPLVSCYTPLTDPTCLHAYRVLRDTQRLICS